MEAISFKAKTKLKIGQSHSIVAFVDYVLLYGACKLPQHKWYDTKPSARSSKTYTRYTVLQLIVD